MDRVELVWVW